MESKQIIQGHAIVVAMQGFVYVGAVSVDDKWCVISDAQNIRVWGTTAGLGELAQNGPTEKTKLDLVGTARIPMHMVVTIIDVEESKWS